MRRVSRQLRAKRRGLKKPKKRVNPSYACIPLKAIILYSTPTSHHTITIHLLKEQRHPVKRECLAANLLMMR